MEERLSDVFESASTNWGRWGDDECGADCVDDGTSDFLYVCSPLKIVGGTASPVNPLVIK